VRSAAPRVVFKPLLMKFSKNCEVGHTGKFGEKSVSLLIVSWSGVRDVFLSPFVCGATAQP